MSRFPNVWAVVGVLMEEILALRKLVGVFSVGCLRLHCSKNVLAATEWGYKNCGEGNGCSEQQFRGHFEEGRRN